MTNTTPKAVLFDLDGTLIDTAPDFIRIIRQMCHKYECTTPSDAQIREQVSAGARAMVRLVLGEQLGDDDPTLLHYRQEFLDLYEADICVDSQLFAGLDELLQALEARHMPWGIVTNKPRYLAEALLHKLKLSERCAVLVCPEDVTHTKPDPEPMFLALDRLNAQQNTPLTPQDCVYVGDHIRDIESGRRAGMVSVVAAYGYIPPEDKDLSAWGADAIVQDVAALRSFLDV